jgi:hypothetical protein
MARIPIYESQVRPSGGATLPGADAGTFGAAIGSALVQAGQVVEGIEDNNARVDARAAAIAQQRSDEDAMADAAVRLARVNATAKKVALTARTEAGPGAPGHNGTVLKTFDDVATAEGAPITNQKAARWWAVQTAELRGGIDSDAYAFEAGARATKLANDVGASIDLESNTLFTNPEPKDFPGTLKRVLGTIDALTAVDDAGKEKLRGEARDQLGTSFIRGLAQKDPYAARQIINSGQFNDIIGEAKLPALNEKIDGEIRGREAEVRRQEAEVRRQAADDRREQREKDRAIGDRVEDTIAHLAAGGTVPDEELRGTIAAASSIGRPELARRAVALGTTSVVTTRFRTASPIELQDHVHELDKQINADGDKASAALLAERKASVDLLANMKTALNTDPLSWASRAGTAKLEAIDWNDPATMAARIAPAKATARRYGVPAQYFTDEEKAGLNATLAAAKPDARLAIALNLAKGFGGEAGQAIASLGQGGTFTHAAGLATYGRKYADVARRVFVGQEAMKTTQLLPKGDKIQSLALEAAGRALAYQPQTMNNAVSVANALYVEKAARRGIKARDEFDEDLWKDGLNEALGGVGNGGGLYTPGTAGVRGYARSNKPQVVLPVGMAPDRFDELVYNITPAEVKAAGGGFPKDGQGRPITISTFRGASLFSKGDGKYLVSLDANGSQFLRGNGPGGYYVLDVKALDKVRTAGGAAR